MWPFRRLRRARDPATGVAAQARELARTAALLASEGRRLGERELAVLAREERLDERLRRESRAIDERRDALTALGQELAGRESRISDLERRAADVEAAERTGREREARLLADELAARRRADELEAAEGHLRAEQEELAAQKARQLLEELRAPADNGPPASSGPEHCLLVVPSPSGYRLVPLEVEPPRPGDTLEVAGEPFAVLRVGRSPLPGDLRRCVFLAA